MSTLNVDALVGNTSANAITVRGEGSATTSLQQGLCKFFSNIVGTGTISTRDSFNQSGITDNGTGDYDLAFTNNMGNDDYCFMTIADSGSLHVAFPYSEGEQNAGGCRSVSEVGQGGNGYVVTDSAMIMSTVDGDLA
jgi:hypothetical protein